MKFDMNRHSAVKIQSAWRGYSSRRRVAMIRQERARYEWMLECTITIQCGIRMALAYKVCQQKRFKKWDKSVKLVQPVLKGYLAGKVLQRLKAREKPIQTTFFLYNNVAKPWKFEFQMAPIDKDGNFKYDGKEGPKKIIDLFPQDEPWTRYFTKQALLIQKLIRGKLARMRIARVGLHQMIIN